MALPAPAAAVPVNLPGPDGLLKKALICSQHFFGGAHQPKHDEESHHGSDKIGVGDFPGAAVVPAVTALFRLITTIGRCVGGGGANSGAGLMIRQPWTPRRRRRDTPFPGTRAGHR